MERLDRAFARVDWIHSYPHYCLRNQPILHSDHGPIIVDFEHQLLFRHRPFRFKHMWLTHPTCKEVIQRAWNTHSIGSRAFQFKIKTSRLRSTLMHWNNEVFGKVEKQILDKQSELQHIQNDIHNLEDVRKERTLREDLETLMNRKEMKWAQKARNKGIVLGDRNTKFFQTIVKQRRARSRILQIKTSEGIISEDPKTIDDTICNHFRLSFDNPSSRSHSSILEEPNCLPIPKLSTQQLAHLNRPITNEEIEDTIFQLGPQKAPSLDGLPAFFYHEFWNTVKRDIFNTINVFFHSSFLLKTLNHTFITLIPKIHFPEEVSHYRPISLCNVIYKIISKLMVNRLKPLMDSLITPFSKCFYLRKEHS